MKFTRKLFFSALMAVAATGQAFAQEWTEIFTQTFDDLSTTGINGGGLMGSGTTSGRYTSETEFSPAAWIGTGGFKFGTTAFLSADDWKVEFKYAPRGNVNFYLKANDKDITEFRSSLFCAVNDASTAEKDLVWYDVTIVGDKTAGTVTMTVPAGTTDYQSGKTVGSGFFNIDEIGFWDGNLAFIDEVHCYVKDALAAYKAERDAALAAANTWYTDANTNSTIPSAALTDLNNVLTATTNTETKSSQSEYETATTNINNALDLAKLLVDPYTIFKLVKENVNKDNAITGQSGVFEANETAVSTLTSAISSASADNETTADGINTQTASIYTAVKTFLQTVTINSGKAFDLTSLIVNGDLAATLGWQVNTNDPMPTLNTTYKNAEYYEKWFTFFQTLPNMPAGNYTFQLKGFYREGANDAAYAAYNAGTATAKGKIYVNDANANATNIKNVMSEHSESITTNVYTPATGINFPNGMEGARAFFDAGFYNNEVLFNQASDGNMTLGFTGGGNRYSGVWICFGDFKLLYSGDKASVAMSETQDFSAVSDISGADVTLTRTFLESDKYNTLVLPFDVTNAELKTALGSGITVYTYTGTTTTDGTTTLGFSTTTADVSAHTPIVVKGVTASGPYTFTGRTVEAGSAGTVSDPKNVIDFVGSYLANTNIAEGNFFFGSDNEIYRSTGKSKMKGFRAYFKVNEQNAGARLQLNFDDAEVTGISEIENGKSVNGQYFDLQGRRVASPKKGLYIMSGKKIIVK